MEDLLLMLIILGVFVAMLIIMIICVCLAMVIHRYSGHTEVKLEWQIGTYPIGISPTMHKRAIGLSIHLFLFQIGFLHHLKQRR